MKRIECIELELKNNNHEKVEMSRINSLLDQIEEAKITIKDLKTMLDEELMETEIYKTVFESTRSTVDENGYECPEKEAHKHALKMALLNYKTPVKKEKN